MTAELKIPGPFAPLLFLDFKIIFVLKHLECKYVKCTFPLFTRHALQAVPCLRDWFTVDYKRHPGNDEILFIFVCHVWICDFTRPQPLSRTECSCINYENLPQGDTFTRSWLFREFTPRRSVVTQISGIPVGPIFKGQADLVLEDRQVVPKRR